MSNENRLSELLKEKKDKKEHLDFIYKIKTDKNKIDLFKRYIASYSLIATVLLPICFFLSETLKAQTLNEIYYEIFFIVYFVLAIFICLFNFLGVLKGYIEFEPNEKTNWLSEIKYLFLFCGALTALFSPLPMAFIYTFLDMSDRIHSVIFFNFLNISCILAFASSLIFLSYQVYNVKKNENKSLTKRNLEDKKETKERLILLEEEIRLFIRLNLIDYPSYEIYAHEIKRSNDENLNEYLEETKRFLARKHGYSDFDTYKISYLKDNCKILEIETY
jgi:hypothetical protein